jgi:hypothetical protein
MNMSKLFALAAVGVVLAAVPGKPASAAGPVVGYAGTALSNVAGCPAIIWRIAKQPDGKLSGIVYYADMMGLSSAEGYSAGGTFKIVLKSTMGDGPEGTIEGARKPNGGISSKLVGKGCANFDFSSSELKDLGRDIEKGP